MIIFPAVQNIHWFISNVPPWRWYHFEENSPEEAPSWIFAILQCDSIEMLKVICLLEHLFLREYLNGIAHFFHKAGRFWAKDSTKKYFRFYFLKLGRQKRPIFSRNTNFCKKKCAIFTDFIMLIFYWNLGQIQSFNIKNDRLCFLFVPVCESCRWSDRFECDALFSEKGGFLQNLLFPTKNHQFL